MRTGCDVVDLIEKAGRIVGEVAEHEGKQFGFLFA